MAITPNYAGAALIKVDCGVGLESLGYTANGAELTFHPFFLDVPGDQNGGDAGPSIDEQFLGEEAQFRLEMTKWETSVADKIAARLASGTAGTIGAAGTLMVQEAKYMRLLIHTPTTPFNFPIAIFRENIEINKGVKFSRLILAGHAKMNLSSRVLYNSTTS